MSFSSVRSSSLLPSSTASNNYSTFAPSAEPMNLVCPPDSPTGSDATLDSLVHFRKTDYRGFLFVNHEKHGLVLLHCTRKQKKGSHYQLPGGHVDDAEFLQAARTSSDRDTQLQLACRMGAVRELYEETGIDLRNQLSRINPVPIQTEDTDLLENEYKNRLFFVVHVTDRDFLSDGVAPEGSRGSHLKLRLSVEHSGYVFEPDPSEAAKKIYLHSGGKCSNALLMAMNRRTARDAAAGVSQSKQPSKYDEGLELIPRQRRVSNGFCCFRFCPFR